jgi:hypothetical protein
MDFQGFLLGIPSETVAANAYFLNIMFQTNFSAENENSTCRSPLSLSLFSSQPWDA